MFRLTRIQSQPRALAAKCDTSRDGHINEEFRRRVNAQGSFPSENCARVLLYSLVASDQINLRRIDVYEKIVDVIAREEDAAA